MKYLLSTVLLFIAVTNSFCQLTVLHEDFSNCITTIPNQWHPYNVSGTDAWQCNSAGYLGNGVSMSGYSGSTNHDNEDWLISPYLDFSSYTNPILSFRCRTKYNGQAIQVKVSNNYNGLSDPNLAIWSTLTTILPATNSDVWFLSDSISLQLYKNQALYIAFKYMSTTSAAATWILDDVNVADGSLVLSDQFINVGQSAVGLPSSSTSFSFVANGGISSFTVDAPPPFEVSKDNMLFSNQLSYSTSIAGMAQTVYVRINPTVADKVYRNTINFSLNGNIMPQHIMLLGTSLPDNKTLRVFNWNMRWFGDPSLCGCDTVEARMNATHIMKDINADVYCLQEIVNVNEIGLIAADLGPKYQYVVSPFGSFATTPSDPDYATDQKMAYIYNTDKIENLGTFGLLASTYPADAGSGSPYYCFASGRFPFVLKAKIKLDNTLTDTVIFSNIHAKALSDVTSYNRRQGGAVKMTDSLNALFPGKKVMVIGDYNDFLEGTDVSSLSVSPYQYMLDHGFTGITLPSHFPNQTTYVGGVNTIFDNVACTPNLMAIYPDSSCFIFDEVEKYIPDYSNTTSDHLPVMSYFRFNFPIDVAVKDISKTNSIFTIINPSSNTLQLSWNESADETINVSVYDITGNKLYAGKVSKREKKTAISLPSLHDGFYFVEVSHGQYHDIKKWLVR